MKLRQEGMRSALEFCGHTFLCRNDSVLSDKCADDMFDIHDQQFHLWSEFALLISLDGVNWQYWFDCIALQQHIHPMYRHNDKSPFFFSNLWWILRWRRSSCFLPWINHWNGIGYWRVDSYPLSVLGLLRIQGNHTKKRGGKRAESSLLQPSATRFSTLQMNEPVPMRPINMPTEGPLAQDPHAIVAIMRCTSSMIQTEIIIPLTEPSGRTTSSPITTHSVFPSTLERICSKRAESIASVIEPCWFDIGDPWSLQDITRPMATLILYPAIREWSKKRWNCWERRVRVRVDKWNTVSLP